MRAVTLLHILWHYILASVRLSLNLRASPILSTGIDRNTFSPILKFRVPDWRQLESVCTTTEAGQRTKLAEDQVRSQEQGIE